MSVAGELSGKCVLVVEDDYVLAREICNDLRDHGVSVIGPAPTVHYARLLLGKRKLDGAILDIKLFGEEVFGLADTLLADGVPIVFATAYQPDQIAGKYKDVDTIHKPVSLEKLRQKVADFQPGKPITLSHPPAPETLFRGPVRARAPGYAQDSIYDQWSRSLAAAMQDAR